MKEVTLKIPDSKFNFFMELVKNLGFVKTNDIDIPEKDKALVRERMKNSKADELLDWDNVKDDFDGI